MTFLNNGCFLRSLKISDILFHGFIRPGLESQFKFFEVFPQIGSLAEKNVRNFVQSFLDTEFSRLEDRCDLNRRLSKRCLNIFAAVEIAEFAVPHKILSSYNMLVI